MSDQVFELKGWKGESKGVHSASSIRKMWEAGEISGLDRVVTTSGEMGLEDFFAYQENLAVQTAEESRMRLEQEKISQEHTRLIEEETRRQELSLEQTGKIYYLYLNGNKNGPHSKNNLRIMYNSGKIDEDTMVWTREINDWLELRGFMDDLGLRDAKESSSKSGFSNLSSFEYGGFWLRFAAVFLDWILSTILVFLACFAITFIYGSSGFYGGLELYLLATLVSGVGNWFYYSLFECSGKRATPGKLACGLVVVGLDGEKISFLKASGRYFGKIISSLILGIGFLMCAFTAKKQCLHDMMANCLVVHKR